MIETIHVGYDRWDYRIMNHIIILPLIFLIFVGLYYSTMLKSYLKFGSLACFYIVES